LNGDKLLAEIYGVSIHPAITINGQIYRGDLTGYDVFRAICASFTQGFRPYECLQEFDIQRELGNAREAFRQPSGVNPAMIVVSLVAVILLNGGLIYACRRWQQKKTNKRVAESV
jgi:hypothetical protein